MATLRQEAQGDPVLASTFHVEGRKRRVLLFRNGITLADDCRHARPENDEFIALGQLVAAEPWPSRDVSWCTCERRGGATVQATTASAACLVPEPRAASADCGLRLHVARPVRKHSWTLQTLLLRAAPGDQALVHRWADALQDALRGESRPRRLLVLVNPFGGRKRAPRIYQRKVAPIFQLAGIAVQLVTTRYSGHAKQCILEMDLDSLDGVVCVGGDGMVNEVVNGVLLRSQRDAGVEANDAGACLRPAALKVGVIPAGSTDALVCTTTGEDSPTTSALLIVMGAEVAVDVASIHSGDRLVRYSAGFLSYGFFGDNIKASEKFRWMGPLRYSWTGWQTFLKHHTYEGEVRLLVDGQASSAHNAAGNERCRVGCEVCRDAVGVDRQRPCDPKDSSSQKDGSEPYWVAVRGQFLSLSCALMANRCARSSAGVAPTAHLGNGLMDVVLVSRCSRRNFLRFLLALANSETRSPFKFPFVHCFRTTCLEFVPKVEAEEGAVKRTGTWQCDGELLAESSLLVRSHCQLLKLFAYGIEEREEHRVPPACFCSGQ
ncbi:ceramide kinase-like [Ixodes scapularis]|uniref:ceramide kinase-like n=1 Tax=Ixodes scapularis TaxID=6945 RepID=UPI001C383B6A|nr:ceramide kinase-like [Ixodes scapularis]